MGRRHPSMLACLRLVACGKSSVCIIRPCPSMTGWLRAANPAHARPRPYPILASRGAGFGSAWCFRVFVGPKGLAMRGSSSGAVAECTWRRMSGGWLVRVGRLPAGAANCSSPCSSSVAAQTARSALRAIAVPVLRTRCGILPCRCPYSFKHRLRW